MTVNLGKGGDSKRAEGVNYREPGAPFQRDAQPDVDSAWKNPVNGNVISFLSDCKDPSDPPLDHIVQGALTGLSELHYDSSESPMVQGRESRRVSATGKVDGVPTQIDLLVFKRNSCIYILTYVGVKRAFNDNRAEFNAFVQGFKAP